MVNNMNNNGTASSTPPQNVSPKVMDNHQQHNDGGELSSRQNDYIAAELWRMQQAREEENNALMQLLSARQSGSMNGGSSSAFGNGMNGGGNGRDFDSGNNGGNNSSAISNYAAAMNNTNHLDNLNPISISSMNNSGGLGGSSTPGMFNFMNSRAVTMTSVDKAANSNNNMSSAAGGSSSSEFNRNDNFDAQQMSNFMASQGYGMSNMNSSMPSNMNTEYDYLLQQQLLHGSTAGMQGSSIQGMNNLDIYLSSAAAAAQQAYPQEDPGWEEQFKALRTYQMQFGNCKVPARFKANPKLGRWVMTQRRQFTLLMQGFPSALTADRIRRLESIGFTWTVRPEPVTTWNTKFQELKGKLSFMQYVCSHLVYTLSSSLQSKCQTHILFKLDHYTYNIYSLQGHLWKLHGTPTIPSQSSTRNMGTHSTTSVQVNARGEEVLHDEGEGGCIGLCWFLLGCQECFCKFITWICEDRSRCQVGNGWIVD